MPLKRAMACTGNADSTFWHAVKVFNDCNVPLAQTVIPEVKRGAKCFFLPAITTGQRRLSQTPKD